MPDNVSASSHPECVRAPTEHSVERCVLVSRICAQRPTKRRWLSSRCEPVVGPEDTYCLRNGAVCKIAGSTIRASFDVSQHVLIGRVGTALCSAEQQVK